MKNTEPDKKKLLALLRLRGYIKCTCKVKMYPQKILKIYRNFALVKATTTGMHPWVYVIYNMEKSETMQLCSNIAEFDGVCQRRL